MVTSYARIKNQYKIEDDTILSASVYKLNEEVQAGDEIELFTSLNLNRN